MLPLTHLLSGLAVAVWAFEKGLFPGEYVVYTALISMFIDVDHLFSYLSSNGEGFRGKWNILVVDKLRYQRTLIHHAKGMLLISVLISLTYFIKTEVYYCLILSYGTHMLLDHLHIRNLPKVRKYHIEGFGMILPVSILELGLDVFFIAYLLGWSLL